MNVQRQSFTLIALSLTFACTRGEPPRTPASIDVSASTAPSFDHTELHPVVLKAQPFVESGLSNPSAIAVVGPYVVVADQTKSDSMLKVYRATDGSLAFATGRAGEGPGEYRTIWGLQAVPWSTEAGPTVSVFDVRLRRLTEVDLSPAGQALEPAERPIVTLRPEATPTQALWETDSTILALGFFREGRLVVFNKLGEQVGLVGPLPVDNPAIPASVLSHAYQSFLARKPDGSLLVVANRHAGRLEILRPDGERTAVVRGPYYFEPKFTVDQAGDSAKTPIFGGAGDLRFGYQSVTCTDREILALFSGRVRKDFKGEAIYGQYVHVFDWSGRFLRAYDLGQTLFQIDVDPAGKRLYAIEHEPEVGVVMFELVIDPSARRGHSGKLIHAGDSAVVESITTP